MDEESERVVRRLALPHVQIVSLAELGQRDPATPLDEGCAHPGRVLLDGDAVDLPAHPRAEPSGRGHLPRRRPDVLLRPRSCSSTSLESATLIVPHRYAPRASPQGPTSGTYNVEWLTFRRDEDGLAALQWWHDRCIEWCFFRSRTGSSAIRSTSTTGPLPRRVHVLEHPGGGLAPWNVTAHELAEGTTRPARRRAPARLLSLPLAPPLRLRAFHLRREARRSCAKWAVRLDDQLSGLR